MPWFFSSKEEQARERARAEAARLDRELRREANYYSKLIPKVLSNCGIDHIYPRADRPGLVESRLLDKKGRQMVKILEARYNPYAIYLWVETRELPYHQDLTKLHSDAVLETLAAACERMVQWRSYPGKGSWYVVWRDGAINAIPNLVSYDDTASLIYDNAGPLAFIAGVGENNHLVRADLVDMPHYLIAGSTGTGKSTHTNAMICQIISRCSPRDVEFVMIDLKGGAEFAFYERLPHLRFPIVKNADRVCETLDRVQELLAGRMGQITAAHHKNIEGYNDSHRDEPIPYLVLVIDELAQVLKHPDRKMAREAELRLGAILSTARASGGHVVLCTQRPSSDIVTPFITTNAPVRICFSVPTQPNSITVIGVGKAMGLEPAGRAQFLRGPTLTEIQSPFISNKQIDAIVHEAIARAGGTAPANTEEGVTLDEVLREAVENYNCKLSVDTMFEAFRGRATQTQIREMIRGLNGEPVVVNGRAYKIRRGRGASRILTPIEPDPPATDNTIRARIVPVKRFMGLNSPHARFSVGVPVPAAEIVQQDPD